MHERQRNQAGSDGVCWWCTTCKTTKSIRANSFFTKSKLTLQQWFILIVWWAREYPVSAARSEAEVTEVTSCQVYEWLRYVCFASFQIDESQFSSITVDEKNLAFYVFRFIFRIYMFPVIKIAVFLM